MTCYSTPLRFAEILELHGEMEMALADHVPPQSRSSDWHTKHCETLQDILNTQRGYGNSYSIRIPEEDNNDFDGDGLYIYGGESDRTL